MMKYLQLIILRHDFNAHYLRNWKLEGSLDGKNWICLKEHINDSSLNSPLSTESWKISPPQKENEKLFFKYFRIFQTGKNGSGHHHLMMNGFEIYGDLRKMNEK